MNDEWCRCPICFEDYSTIHRPTTFECGHSICVDHVIGPQRLQLCPICRKHLPMNRIYNVSYNLLEASNLFQSIKDKINWSEIRPPPVEVRDSNQISAAELLRRDEVYARRLQAELNTSTVAPQPTVIRPIEIPTAVNRQLPNDATTNNVNRNRSRAHGRDRNTKDCGHPCDLRATAQCCACSDRRPNAPGQQYPMYADGHRMTSTLRRDEWYCPSCKQN